MLNATKIGGRFNESEKVPVNYRFVVSVCVAQKFSFTEIHSFQAFFNVSILFLWIYMCYYVDKKDGKKDLES